MKLTIKNKRAVSLLLAAVTAFSASTPALAAQSGEYGDPATGWISSESRTNALNANAVAAHEAFYCVRYCKFCYDICSTTITRLLGKRK